MLTHLVEEHHLLIPKIPPEHRAKPKGETLWIEGGNFLLFHFHNRSDAPG
jgi:hypothetical protein